MKSKLLVLALAAMMITPAMADDEPAKKGKGKGKKGQQSPAAQLIKKLADVGLTDDQTAKIQELGKATQAEIKKLQDSAGLTQEVLKKRREVMAKMKDSDKKGKERMEAINAAAGITEAHAKALVAVNEIRAKLNKSVIAMLTDEQKAKLPKAMQPKAGKKNKGEKKKKDAE